jgi:membrane dipeptidase
MTGAWTISDEAQSLHDSAIVIDTHIDTITHLLWHDHEFNERLTDARVDIPLLREGGVNAAFFAIWVDDKYDKYEALQYTLRGIDVMFRTIDNYPDDLAIALTAADVEQAKSEGKVAVLLSIEGGRAFSDDLGVLRQLYKLGIRSATLCWGDATSWIDSCNDEPHGGLTDFGRTIIAEMNQVGMFPDISHVSDKAFYDVLEASSRPVFASHSSCRDLTPARRNMTDEMIVALAENGGVININFGAGFVTHEPADAHLANLNDWDDNDYDGWGRIGIASGEIGPPIDDLIDHFEHAIDLVGAEHVGIGTDFDGVKSLPVGMDHIGRLPIVTDLLLKRGRSEAEVTNVLGASNMRLFREVMD